MSASAGRLPFVRNCLTALLCIAVSTVSCSSLQVPVSFPGYETSRLSFSISEGIRIGVRPVISREEYQQLFDDYLPEIGLVAVWLEVKNNRPSTITMPRLKWKLQRGGTSLKQVDASSVLRCYYRRRKIRMYTINTDLRAKRNLESVMIAAGSISASGEKSGFAFFMQAQPISRDWMRHAVLVNRDIDLDDGRRVEIQLPLTYASP
jgi:hypothetical protein